MDDEMIDDLDDLDDLDDVDGGDVMIDDHSSKRIDADSILDSLVPQSIDWRETVRRHPVGSVACVGLVGYLVGRTKGSSIMTGVTAGLSSGIMRQLADVFEGDFFDF